MTHDEQIFIDTLSLDRVKARSFILASYRRSRYAEDDIDVYRIVRPVIIIENHENGNLFLHPGDLVKPEWTKYEGTTFKWMLGRVRR